MRQYWNSYLSMGNDPASRTDPTGGSDGGPVSVDYRYEDGQWMRYQTYVREDGGRSVHGSPVGEGDVPSSVLAVHNYINGSSFGMDIRESMIAQADALGMDEPESATSYYVSAQLQPSISPEDFEPGTAESIEDYLIEKTQSDNGYEVLDGYIGLAIYSMIDETYVAITGANLQGEMMFPNEVLDARVLGIGNLALMGYGSMIKVASANSTSLVSLTEETFAQATFYGAEEIGSYSIFGTKGMVGNTFNRNIFLLETSQKSLSGFLVLLETIELEATGLGATRISIYGSSVVNKGFLNPNIATRFGYTFQRSGSGVILQKPLTP